jgi:desulfoferrodoxin-like iron-binding protein
VLSNECWVTGHARGILRLDYSQHSALVPGVQEIDMANQMGKRYMCSKCGVEVIITKAGGGTLVCCGQDMVMKK